MMRQWAVRELSYEAPSLERIFASIALGEEGTPAAAPKPASAAPSAPAAPSESGGLQLDVSEASAAPAAEQPKPSARTLNPFENFGGGA